MMLDGGQNDPNRLAFPFLWYPFLVRKESNAIRRNDILMQYLFLK